MLARHAVVHDQGSSDPPGAAEHALTLLRAAAGIGFTELDNGFATTDDPAGLQHLCQDLAPGVIRECCQRWWARSPLPFTDADRAGGYWWDIAMRQVEVSRTIVFNAPAPGAGFFEALSAATRSGQRSTRCPCAKRYE